jgi:hypothetical protein
MDHGPFHLRPNQVLLSHYPDQEARKGELVLQPPQSPALSLADLCHWGYLMVKHWWKEEITKVEIWLSAEATATKDTRLDILSVPLIIVVTALGYVFELMESVLTL